MSMNSPHPSVPFTNSNPPPELGEELDVMVMSTSSTTDWISIILWVDPFDIVPIEGEEDGNQFINNWTVPKEVKVGDWIVVRAVYDTERRVYRILSFVEKVPIY